jgi:hypothetical protein
VSAWWSQILPWRKERPVPYTPRKSTVVGDLSSVAVTEEDRKALGEAFRRARASSTARVAPTTADEKSVTRRPCRYCPDPLCPEDCPECGSPIHDLDAVPAQHQRDVHPEEPQLMADVSPGIGDIQVTRQLGRGLIVDKAPPRARMTLALLAEHGYGLSMASDNQINIADQVLYEVTGYDADSASLLLELVEDWRKPSVLTFDRKLTDAEMEDIKTRWREAHGTPGAAHVVTEMRAETPRDSASLDRVRALEASLWESVDGRAMPVSAVCHSSANDLRAALNPPPEPDDPPVQCWHTEPDTPCDWDVCRQPERLAAGDRGTDPARKERP